MSDPGPTRRAETDSTQPPRAASDEASAEAQRRLQATRQIDALCDEFEDAIEGGDTVALQPFLDRVETSLHPVLLKELVGIACERLRPLGKAEVLSRLCELDPHLSIALRDEVERLLQEQKTLSGDGLILHTEQKALTPRRKKSRGLHLRCPHCSNHVELVGDTPLDAVDCTTCGSRFSLVDRSRETNMAETLQQIDRFELVSRLGFGGFGTVWKARDTELDRTVAIKIPRHGQLSNAEIEQFLREARSAAQLNHPNIVPVHEVGREGDAVFIVSDLVRGFSLSDLLTSRQLSITESVELSAKVADALEHAHMQGVVHRDLKPSNVMIDEAGEPHLMDFGLAKRDAEEVTMTTDGQIIGTPAYMSPEQAGGLSAFADRRTDIYSLGVMLFELLTGELPFRGNAQMQVQLRLNEDAPNARRFNKHLPLDLSVICAKCLEREVGRRYQTAAEVHDELTRYLQNRPILARPPSRLERLMRWSARSPYRAAACLLLAALAIGGPTVALVIESQRERLAQLVEEKNHLIELKADEATQFREQATGLRSQLDLWEGKANPWEIWPPARENSPTKRQLKSLLSSRQQLLETPSGEESDQTAAQRLFALALLHESAGRTDEAVRDLLAALPPLERMRERQPRSLSIAAAVQDAYRLLAQLDSKEPEKAKKWIAATRDLSSQLAQEFPLNPKLQADQIDAGLRQAVATGFESAATELEDAAKSESRLRELWPRSIPELYRLTCQLAGIEAPLAGPLGTDSNATKTSPD